MRALILGLCFTLAVAKLEMSVEANAIADALGELQLNGRSRESGMASAQRDNAVSMVKKLATLRELSDDDKKTVSTVVDMLREILTNLQTDKNTRQAMLDAFPGQVADCQDPAHVALEEQFRAQQETLKGDHKTCRDAEAGFYDEYVTECGHFVQQLTYDAEDHTQCEKDQGKTWTASESDMNEWLTFLNLINEWFIKLESKYNDHPTSILVKCNNSLTAWTASRTECNTKQGEFQAEHCKWIHYKYSRCDGIATCAAMVQATYDSEKASAQSSSSTRTNEVEMLTLVICYLEYIRDTADGNSQAMHDGCALSDAAKDAIAQSYETSYDQNMTAPHCDPQDGVVNDVGNIAAWAAATYSDINSAKSPYEDVGMFCATDNWTS